MYDSDYDPEGLLSTITTSAVTVCAGSYPTLWTTLIPDLGMLISTYLVPWHQRHCISSETSTVRTKIIFYLSIFLISLFLIHPIPSFLQIWLPLSKPLWTPPFLFQTTGITLLSWLLASLIDIYPMIRGTNLLEAMGRRSLEVYLAAEILEEFMMYSGKRRGGGLWEKIVRGVEGVGLGRAGSCLLVSFCWASAFAWFGWVLDQIGWKIKL